MHPAPQPQLATGGGGSAVVPEGFDSVQDVFDYGYCHALALALNEETGWPIVGLKGPAGYADHFLVQRPDGRLVDAHGARTEAEVMRQWADGAPDGYYKVQGCTAQSIRVEVDRQDLENPASVWPLAQETASPLAQLPTGT